MKKKIGLIFVFSTSMKNLYILFTLLLGIFQLNAQPELELKSTSNIGNKIPVYINNFGTSYVVDKYVLTKNDGNQSTDYSNFQLGDITTADTFNPLKINLFYSDFNTVIILDNRMAEITKLDFNLIKPFRMVTHVSTGNDNTIWIFDQNKLQLELFDYKRSATRITTLPINETILDIDSDYNYCYLLTDKHILVFNYFGSMISKYTNNGYIDIELWDENLFLSDGKSLFFKQLETGEIQALATPELLINRFFVTEETLYIYDGENLHQYHLKTE